MPTESTVELVGHSQALGRRAQVRARTTSTTAITARAVAPTQSTQRKAASSDRQGARTDG
jgi:hypothetical protein